MINTIIDWILANPKLLTVAAGLVVSIIEVWRQRKKGQATRDTLDATVTYLREQGLSEKAIVPATEAIQSRSRKKKALELAKSGIRVDTAANRKWRDEQAAKLKGDSNE